MIELSNIDSLRFFVPEMVVVGFIVLVVLAELSPRLRRSIDFLTFWGLLTVGAVLALSVRSFPEPPAFQKGIVALLEMQMPPEHLSASGVVLFEGAAAYDLFSIFFKLGFVGATLLVIGASIPVVRRWETGRGEYYALLLSCLLGMMLMASARSLVMMYLALEFTSITSYILAGMLRRNRRSTEASLKYVIYGGGASGIMVFGMAYLYGMTGSMDVGGIGAQIQAMGSEFNSRLALVISTLVMAGFGYKIAAVPFHMWCPDVYEGAPTPVTAFFSVGPKAAGFAMLARFLAGVFGLRSDAVIDAQGRMMLPDPFTGPLPEWTMLMALLAVFTMAVGNLVAIHQNNLKRMLAYSSIAHAGYMLLAFVMFTRENMGSLLFYVAVYIIMNLGAFFVVIVLEERHKIETVEGCAGLGWREPGLCAMMTIFLISLTGLPPTAGFIGKLLIFGYLIKGGAVGISLAVVGVLFSAVSLYYYARIFMAMYLRKPAEGERPVGAPTGGLVPMVWALGVATLFFGLFWEKMYDLARVAGRSLV